VGLHSRLQLFVITGSMTRRPWASATALTNRCSDQDATALFLECGDQRCTSACRACQPVQCRSQASPSWGRRPRCACRAPHCDVPPITRCSSKSESVIKSGEAGSDCTCNRDYIQLPIWCAPMPMSWRICRQAPALRRSTRDADSPCSRSYACPTWIFVLTAPRPGGPARIVAPSDRARELLGGTTAIR
jgi:hypothetical protein